jgi:hypothetical protein
MLIIAMSGDLGDSADAFIWVQPPLAQALSIA